MRIGIDLHGVIDADIKFFSNMMAVLRSDENEIYIVSGPLGLEIIGEVIKLGLIPYMHYDQIRSVVDHLKEKGVKMWLGREDTWWADEKEWWSSKAAICKKHKIDLMIDNDERYRRYFTGHTKFLLYKSNRIKKPRKMLSTATLLKLKIDLEKKKKLIDKKIDMINSITQSSVHKKQSKLP